jgi:DNA transformation protein and related proteins
MDAEGLRELFEPFGPVSVRRMFSGHGLYADGWFFALAIGGEVYLKADAETETVFAAAGSTPFVYQRHTREVKLGFWRLPANAYDDPDELKHWSNLALSAARRAGEAKARKAGTGKAKTGQEKTGKAKTSRETKTLTARTKASRNKI